MNRSKSNGARKSFNKKPGNGGKSKQFKSGEVEVNVPRDDLNEADLQRAAHKYTSKRNDATWYAKNAQLLLDAGQLSFNYPMGVGVPFYQTSKVTEPMVMSPGVCVFHFVPTVGWTVSNDSPVNLAAKLQYANIRYANSGSAYGDPSDLMMYYVACDSLFMFHQMCARAYGIMKLYTYDNRYYPRTLIEAMGLDFDNLNENLAQFRYFINKLAIQIQSLAVPNDISYFVRHSWLTSGLYLDSNSAKAQTYMFHPVGYYKYVEQTTGPNKVVMTTPYDGITVPASTRLTLAKLVSYSTELVNAVVTSEYFGVTTGDILKAFGRDNLFKISEIAEDYVVLPVYNTEVLSQIENASVNRCSLKTLSGFDITQSVVGGNSSLISEAKVEFVDSPKSLPANLYILTNNLEFILNMHVPNPSPADVLVATRLRTMIKNTATVVSTASTPEVTVTQVLAEYGSEVIIGANIYYVNNRSTPPQVQAIGWNNACLHTGSSGVLSQYASLGGLCTVALSQFDWHPQLNLFAGDHNQAQFTTSQPIWLPDVAVVSNYGDTRDIDVFAIVQQAAFKRMNETAMLSLFDSPRVAALTRSPYRK